MKRKIVQEFLSYLDSFALASKSVIALGIRLAFYMQVIAIVYYLYYMDNITLFVVNNTQAVMKTSLSVFTISMIGGIFSDYLLRRNRI